MNNEKLNNQQPQGEPVALPEHDVPDFHAEVLSEISEALGDETLNNMAQVATGIRDLRTQLETMASDRDNEKAMKAKARAQRDRVTAQLTELSGRMAVINRKATEYACTSIPAGPECRFGDEIAALSASAE